MTMAKNGRGLGPKDKARPPFSALPGMVRIPDAASRHDGAALLGGRVKDVLPPRVLLDRRTSRRIRGQVARRQRLPIRQLREGGISG